MPQRNGLENFNYAHNFSITYIDGLVQERRNSSALAMELRLSCINLWTWWADAYIPGYRFVCAKWECVFHVVNKIGIAYLLRKLG